MLKPEQRPDMGAPQKYHYQAFYPLAIVIMLTVVPTVMLVAMHTSLGGKLNSQETPYILILMTPIVIMLFAPIIWVTSILRTKIIIYDHGIEIQGLTKRVKFNWEDILKIEKVAIFSGTFPSYGPPRDLQITLDNKKKINIYCFLASENNEHDAIADVEQIVAINLPKGPA